MCGIVGFWDCLGQLPEPGYSHVCLEMARRISHRGPDDEGVWTDSSLGVALGHRRLSILDLSPTGRQPMESQDGRYVLAFNGEIYNFLDIRADLESLGWSFRGTSDTEVLLAALAQWGPEVSLGKLEGMFAFALWDRKLQSLLLARDRYGKKPLYYGTVGHCWVFASELKAFQSFPGFVSRVDQAALGLYLRFGYVPAPHSIYQNIRKLPPASLVRLGSNSSWPQPSTYWSIPWDSEGLPAAGEFEVEEALNRAVAQRMVADVRVGAFLSGGIDSSLVVALMQEQSTSPVRTFSIGFDEKSHNEAEYAREVATALGTEHAELVLTSNDALALVPSLPQVYDEPFADSSQIPTLLVSQFARQTVTVALSGDGGDEVFAGYNRYIWAPRIWSLLRRVPAPMRQGLAHLLRAMPLKYLARALGGRFAYPEDKLTKLLRLLGSKSPRDVYRSLTGQWLPDSVSTVPTLLETLPGQGDFLNDMMVLDGLTYLPDDILVKVDRASMSVGLEVRSPLLDSRLAEVAWRLPPGCKLAGGRGKIVLRNLLYKRLPAHIFERPKAGFSMPIGSWLRSDLREWAEALLARMGTEEGLICKQLVARRWKEHQAGSRDWGQSFWVLLMLQAWRDRYCPG